MTIEVSKIYKDYPKPVREYMQNVVDCLIQDYKVIPMSWRVSLDLIADNYNMYLKAKEAIENDGLLRKDAHGRTFKNQNINIMNVAQDHIIRLMSSFALTPMSRSKMKNLDTTALKDELDDLIA